MGGLAREAGGEWFLTRSTHFWPRIREIDPMQKDVLDRACRSLWLEIRALCDQQRGLSADGTEDPEQLRVRRRLLELRALSLRYREVQRREAWARWETG